MKSSERKMTTTDLELAQSRSGEQSNGERLDHAGS
jgi:hypothetical protein